MYQIAAATCVHTATYAQLYLYADTCQHTCDFMQQHAVCVCRSFPEDVYASQSLQHPLIATRVEGIADEKLGETLDSLSPLEKLLRCENEQAHEYTAAALWDATSEREAATKLEQVAAEHLPGWEELLQSSNECDGRIDENRG